MKKAPTIILTLIFGVGVNVLAVYGAFALAFLAWGYFDRADYVAVAAAVILFAALLSFLAVKLKKLVNGAAFILCAQLPAVILWAVSYLTAFSNGGGGNLFGLIISAAAMLSALIVWIIIEKKNMPKDRENKPIPQNRLMRKLNEWWNEPLLHRKGNNMNPRIEQLIKNIENVIIGKRGVIEKIICAMIAGGHVLIEDVPGVGKTLLAETLAKSVSGTFGRIQFTPDLMPSDVIGYTVIDQRTGAAEYRAGAAMCNFLLADEINRTSPKVQSSLLEAMEELQISVDGITHKLPVPFMTLATQNPIETYGTYHLPEAQLDRFLMRLSIGYPDRAAELQMLEKMPHNIEVQPVMTLEEVVSLREMSAKVSVSEQVKAYILMIVGATRNKQEIKLGASPRASIALYRAAQAMALINNRAFATPDDVKSMAPSVLGHRVILAAGQSDYLSSEDIIHKILMDTVVPV